MKAELNAYGDIVIKPETATERYALQAWCDGRNAANKGHFVGGSILVDLTPPPFPPAMPKDSKYIKEF